jgi:hypothetical protein
LEDFEFSSGESGVCRALKRAIRLVRPRCDIREPVGVRGEDDGRPAEVFEQLDLVTREVPLPGYSDHPEGMRSGIEPDAARLCAAQSSL